MCCWWWCDNLYLRWGSWECSIRHVEGLVLMRVVVAGQWGVVYDEGKGISFWGLGIRKCLFSSPLFIFSVLATTLFYFIYFHLSPPRPLLLYLSLLNSSLLLLFSLLLFPLIIFEPLPSSPSPLSNVAIWPITMYGRLEMGLPGGWWSGGEHMVVPEADTSEGGGGGGRLVASGHHNHCLLYRGILKRFSALKCGFLTREANFSVLRFNITLYSVSLSHESKNLWKVLQLLFSCLSSE